MIGRVGALCVSLCVLGNPQWLYANQHVHNHWQNLVNTNPTIQIEREGVDIQSAEKGRALSAMLPHLDGEANRGLEQTTTESQDSHLHPNLNSLTARQLLFDGLSKWNHYRSKRAGYREAELSYQNALNRISGQWIVAMINVKKARDIYQLEKDNHDYLKKMLAKVKETLSSNQVDRSAFYQADGEFSEAASELLQAKREQDQALFELEQIIGNNQGDTKSLPSIKAIKKTLPKTQKDYLEHFLTYSLPLRQNKQRIEAHRKALSSARGDFFPVVDVTGTAERDWDQQGAAGKRNVNSVMLNTRFNFLKGGFDLRTVHLKKHQLERSIQEQEQIRREEILKAKNIWLNYHFYAKNDKRLKGYRDNYRKTVDDYTQLFDVGKKDVMQLFVANRQNMRAQRQYILNQYEYQKSIVTAALAIQDVQSFFTPDKKG